MLYFRHMEALVRELTNLGLSEKEAGVYLALLEIGPAAIQDVAERSKTNRSTTYLMMDALMGRGIANAVTRGSRQLYVAEPPERLVAQLRVRRAELEEKERELAEALPLLNAIYNVKREAPQIRYFEGADGLREAQEIFLSLADECIQIVPLDAADSAEELACLRSDHVRALAERAIPVRCLLVMDAPDPARVPEVPHAEVRLIAAASFPVTAELTVRGDHIILFSFRPSLRSVVIQSRDFSNTLRALFNMAWSAQTKVAAE